MSTVDTVIAIIAQKAHVDQSTLLPTTRLASLGIQSLDVLEIVFELESQLGVQVPDDAAEGLAEKSISELADQLDSLQAAGKK